MQKDKDLTVKSERNYQIDFLKLIFSIMVFAAHTVYLTPNSLNGQSVFGVMGYVSVNFFFIVSGILMINSCSKINSQSHGESAFCFVINKIKSILLKYWVALALSIFTYIIAYKQFLSVIIKSVPEICMLESSVYYWATNGPTWYLSAMFIAMIPLSYLLLKNKDTYINISAPTMAVLLYSYLFASQPYATNTFNGVTMYSFLRALCGLSSGAIAYKISLWLKNNVNKPASRFIVTFFEIVLYILFFVTVFHYSSDSGMVYSSMLLLPICVGIAFSQTSLLSRLFKYKIFKFSAPLSLAIYLNHNTGKRLIMVYFPELDFKAKLVGMVIFTIIVSLLYFLIIFLLRKLWDKKLKKLFIN